MNDTLFLRDVLDTPRAIADTLAGLDAASLARSLWDGGARRFVALGSGSSYLACAVSAYLHDALVGPRGSALWAVPTEEFALYPRKLESEDAIVGVSASGEVVDILYLYAQLAGKHRLVGITNAADSALVRASDQTLLMRAGHSQVPTSTKTFIASVLALDALWIELLAAQGVSAVGALREALATMPQEAAVALRETSGPVDRLAEHLSPCQRYYVVGSGPSWPLAQEVALVFKEVAGLSAEAVQAREMIHGISAVVDGTCGVIAVNPRGRGEKTAREVLALCAARDAVAVSVGAPPADLALSYDGDELLSPLVLGGPLFALANELAVRRGTYADHPAWEDEYNRTAKRQTQ